MLANPYLTNEEAAAGMNGDGLGFVLQTTRLTPGKDNCHGYVQHPVAPFKLR